jgi:N-methylhydantoinase A
VDARIRSFLGRIQRSARACSPRGSGRLIEYVIGVDCGGTFTDCVLVDETGLVVSDKALTTPENQSRGILDSIRNVCLSIRRPMNEVLRESRIIALGTTSITNRLLNRRGSRVGLLTTRGHEDAVRIGRVVAKTEGLSRQQKQDPLEWGKPEPLVTSDRIRGLSERVDYQGRILVPISLENVARSLDELVEAGAESIAVCLLWSFMNPQHELRIRDIAGTRHPGLPVFLSSDLAPLMGEYERAVTTVLSAYLGPGAQDDLGSLQSALANAGFRDSLLVMQSHGGVADCAEAVLSPVGLLSSGPAGGAMASALLSRAVSSPNVICADMGGTSFDVALVIGNQPQLVGGATYGRFRCAVSTLEVVSIGTGGGSIARVNGDTGAVSLGPDSTGAKPGPACYGEGGTEATLTDANLVLGRLSPTSFFAGRKALDVDKAWSAIRANIADPLGWDVIRAAAGLIEIAEARMADLIRRLTVERGHDPRDFALLACGGAAPMHVGAFATDLGIAQVIVPALSSVFSALGIAYSPLRVLRSLSHPMRPPVVAAHIRATFEELERAVSGRAQRGTIHASARPQRFVDMRFRNQIHQVRVPVLDELTRAEAVDTLVARFYELYERSFGRGTAYPAAGIELLTFHVAYEIPFTPPPLARSARRRTARTAAPETAEVWFGGSFRSAWVIERDELVPGDAVDGPAIIRGPTSTIVIGPHQKATVDPYENVTIESAA